MKKTIMAGSGIAIVLIIAGLFSVFTGENGDTINDKTGTIQYISLEGGFYGIIGDDGNNYDPVNLQTDFPEFQKNGLKVRFSGKTLEDQVSIHMWGKLIELTDIQEI